MNVFAFELECKEFSEKSEGAIGSFKGYGSTFHDEDQVGDKVAPGAFKKSLAQNDKFPLLWNHDPNKMIGSFKATEDGKGLMIDADIVLGTSAGKDAYALLKAGALKGLSIGYRASSTTYDREKNTRTINEMKLYEVSLTAFPCNEKAVVTSVKAFLDEGVESLSDLEDLLRDKEFSRTEAKAFISKVKEFYRRDADKEAEKSACAELLEKISKMDQTLTQGR